MANYSFKTKSVPLVFGDGWLVRIEKAAFGWVHIGKHSEVIEWDENYENRDTSTHYDSTREILVEETTIERGVRRKSRRDVYHDFRRISPYSYNAIFHIFEFLSGIFSTIRRWVMSIVAWALSIIIGLVIVATILSSLSGLDLSIIKEFLTLMKPIVMIYIILVVVPSLIIAGAGFLLRIILHIDEKVEMSMKKNNYDPNWREQARG